MAMNPKISKTLLFPLFFEKKEGANLLICFLLLLKRRRNLTNVNVEANDTLPYQTFTSYQCY